MYVKHKLPIDAHIALDERNRRIKLLDCGHDPAETVAAAVYLAEQQGLEKIWGVVSPAEWVVLSRIGFTREGTLDGYFAEAPGIAVARYLNGQRAHSTRMEMEDSIVAMAITQTVHAVPTSVPGYRARLARQSDAEAISRMLRAVFETYPTPIDSASAIQAAMDHIRFAVVEYEGAIIGVTSADVDTEHRVAEMTDCAVLPEHRGHGLMLMLLRFLENAVGNLALRSLFTLARATSVPMNLTFARLDYAYRGRLINNCHIAGSWEDMHLWVKPLEAVGAPAEEE